MKRLCTICNQEHRYDKVKKRGKHKVQMCNYCLDVIDFYIRDSFERYGI